MKPLYNRLIEYLCKQGTWVPQSTLEFLSVKHKYTSTEITRSIARLKITSNIGYDYKKGFILYPSHEPLDTLNQYALENF